MRVEHRSSPLLLLLLSTISLAAPAHTVPLSTSLPSTVSSLSTSSPSTWRSQQQQHHPIPYGGIDIANVHLRLHPRKVAASVLASSQSAWINYYSSTGSYLSEDSVPSGDCLDLSTSSWGIIYITPTDESASSDNDTIILYNDRICGAVNNEAASQTGPVIVSQYFSTVPQSLRWTRVQAALSTTTTPTTASQIILSPTSPVPTTPTNSITAITTATATATATTGGVPAPIHTNFPTALIPPQPISLNSTSGDDCSINECKHTSKVNLILIIGVVIAIVVVSCLGAGAYYVFRTFHTPNSVAGSSTNRSNVAQGGGSGAAGALDSSSFGTGSGTALTGFNDDYQYIHEEDENATPRFMFSHRHDNVDTNKNPKLFQENTSSPSSSRTRYSDPPTHLLGSFQHNPSDISLIERTK